MFNDTSWLLLGAVVSSGGGPGAGVSSWNTRTGAVVLTSADIIAAQPYVPVDKAGDTMLGPFVLAANAALPLQATPLQQVQALIAAIPSGGVNTWNGRAGAVVMNGADVVGALGYTPANKAGETFGGAVSAPSLAATGAVTGATVTATGAVTGKQFTQTPNINAAATGSLALDYVNGQSQELTITGALTISAINNVAVGNILRLAFRATNVGAVTWPAAVKWPGGTVPDLASGTVKQAVVVLEAVTGGNLLANAAAY
jgi:hypothetical protein